MAGGTWTKEFVNSVYKNTVSSKKTVNSVAPRNRVWVDTSSTMICVYIVYMYVSSRVAAVCTYVHITWQHLSSPRNSSTQKRGPERSPFLRIPAGIFISSTGSRTAMCTYCT